MIRNVKPFEPLVEFGDFVVVSLIVNSDLVKDSVFFQVIRDVWVVQSFQDRTCW